MSDAHPSRRSERDPLATWDDILDLVAEDDAETGESREADRQWSHRLDARVKSRVAELRRRLTPIDVSIKHGVTIPPEIQLLNRSALVAQLENLRRDHGLRYAHRDLTRLSKDSLRILLTLAIRAKKK